MELKYLKLEIVSIAESLWYRQDDHVFHFGRAIGGRNGEGEERDDGNGARLWLLQIINRNWYMSYRIAPISTWFLYSFQRDDKTSADSVASLSLGAKRRLFNLLRGRFWSFSPRRGDTLHRWGEIWHKGGDRRGWSPPPCQISPPPVQRLGYRILKTEIFTEIWPKCGI